MKRTLVWLMLTAGSAAAADVTGTWLISGKLGTNLINLSCTLGHTGSKITGSCTGNGINSPVTDGSSEGAAVTFQYNMTVSGKPVPAIYTGSLSSPGVLKGTVVAQGVGSGTFSATKR